MRTLIKESLCINDVNSTYVAVVAWLAVVIVAVAAAWAAWLVVRRIKDKDAIIHVAFLLLLVIPILANVVQHHRDGTLYLVDRPALFVYVPFALVTISTIQLSFRKDFGRIVVTSVLATAVMFNFFRNISLRATWEWAFDNCNVTILNRMNKNGPHDRLVRFKSSWLFEESMRYHVATTHKGRFELAATDIDFRETVDSTYDYYYVPEEYMARFGNTYTVDTLVVVANTDCYGGALCIAAKSKIISGLSYFGDHVAAAHVARRLNKIFALRILPCLLHFLPLCRYSANAFPNARLPRWHQAPVRQGSQ